MTERQPVAQTAMRVNAYEVLRRAVEEGVGYGIMRAFKHDDHPSQSQIQNEVESAVLSMICEVFQFEEPGQ